MYGAEVERHGFSISLASEHPIIVEGDEISHQRNESATIVQWRVRACRQIITFDTLEVYILGETMRTITGFSICRIHHRWAYTCRHQGQTSQLLLKEDTS